MDKETRSISPLQKKEVILKKYFSS